MKNLFYMPSLKLLMIFCSTILVCYSARAETKAAAEEFKVQLRPASKSEKATADSEQKPEEHKAVTETTATAEAKVVSETISIVEVKPTPAEPKVEPAAETKAVTEVKKVVAAQTNSLEYHRDIRTVDAQTIYVVNGRAPHLYMVSRDLYGSERNWKAIAEWNSLIAPYDLRPGQQLILKKAPTISDAEADRILLKAWAAMDRWDIIKGIILAQQNGQPTARVDMPVLPAPPPEAHAAPSTEAAPVIQPDEAAQATHSHDGHWSFKTSAVVSYFRLEGKYNDLGVDNVLFSEVDYGIELEAAYHFSEDTELILGASVEKMDIHPAADHTEIEGESQYLARYSLGVESELSPRITFAGHGAYEQTPFAIPTLDGTEVEAIFIPQISLGVRWGLVDSGRFNMALITDGILLMQKTHEDLELKTGGGFLVGFKFANELDRHTLTYGISYRDLRQDSADSNNTLRSYYGNIGMIW